MPRGKVMSKSTSGFTLIEVLIALTITTIVSTIAYASISTVITGVESTRRVADRTYEINRAWMIISRDLRQFSPRPVRDEFGEEEPAMSGGVAARFLLSFTRAGWHNPVAQQRSNLQRVNYLIEDESLWRESYAVLDRASDTSPNRVKLLEGVEYLDLRFLASVGEVEMGNDRKSLDTRSWAENWVVDTSRPGVSAATPMAIEIRMQLEDQGELRRIYALPPI